MVYGSRHLGMIAGPHIRVAGRGEKTPSHLVEYLRVHGHLLVVQIAPKVIAILLCCPCHHHLFLYIVGKFGLSQNVCFQNV